MTAVRKRVNTTEKLIMISANTAWNLYSRKRLLRALSDAGWRIIALAAPDANVPKIEGELGITFIPLPMQGDGTNVLKDLRLFYTYLRQYRNHRPRMAFHINNKPNIYGSLAASLCGIPSAANITGLGIVAEKRGITRLIVNALYRIAFFSRKTFVFFQNEDDRHYFIDNSLIVPERTGLLPGSGVDTESFSPDPASGNGETVNFLYNSRLVISKGIREFIEAARNIRLLYRNINFTIIGDLVAGNPIFLPPDELEKAIQDGIIVYHGSVEDVRPYLRTADCVVLPSWYREGVPRALLEAAATGKPLIVADSVGTREPVEDGINGFRIPPRDATALQDAMKRFIELSIEKKKRMGIESRRIAVTRFSDSIVIQRYLERLVSAGN